MGASDKNDIKVERAKRIKMLRGTTCLNRKEFAIKHNINPTTLTVWELPKAAGLSIKGAKILVEAFKNEGISCTAEWLLYGTGGEPKIGNIMIPSSTITTDNPISEELKLFYQHSKDPMHIKMPDQSMAPYCLSGDYLAGDCQEFRKIEDAVNYICIINLINKNNLVRQIETSSNEGFYMLKCLNPVYFQLNQIVSKKDIAKIAPILWIRRSHKKQL